MDKVYKKIVQDSDIGYAYHKITCDSNDIPYDYECIEVNKAFEKCIGLKKEEIIGEKIHNILPDIVEKDLNWIEHYERVAIKGEKYEYEKYSKTMDKWYKIQVFSPEKYYFVTNCIDITDQKKIEEDLKNSKLRYEQVAKKSRSVAWEVDKNGLYTYMSPVSEAVFGYKPEEMVGKMYFYDNSFTNGKNEDSKDYILDIIKKKQNISNFENKLKNKNNEDVWVSTNGFAVLDDEGELLVYRGVDIDITYLKKIEEEITFLSFRDQLTGLYNRRFFEEELLRLDTERNLPISVTMIDVDGLKLINDAFGHEAGDLALKKTAKIIKTGCRADDIISRVGGDEFVILLPKTSLDEAKAIVDRINSEIKKEKVEAINLSISFGCATKRYEYENIEDIIKIADNKMYNYKTLGRVDFRKEVIETILERLFQESPEEKFHSQGVSQLSEAIGRAINLSDLEIEKLKDIGKFHDIGKIVINKEILVKKEELTEEDWKEIKRHPEAGYIILSSSSEHGYFAEDVLYHHERYDGKGYPKGLKGEEIPLNSRIISLAASYDTMLRGKTYRKGISSEEAIKIILEEAGKQFDFNLVEAFIKFNIGNRYKK